MDGQKYVSLHNHTIHSLMDSLITPVDLFAKVKELGQPAVAITDHGTLFAAWDGWKASQKTGVKLLIGCEFNFVDDLRENQVPRHLILIAKNHEGYKNLLNINKIAFDNMMLGTKKVIPRIDWDVLEQNYSGLICTTACSGGILGQLINTRKSDQAFQQAQRLKSIFGDSLFFEIQPHAMVRKATTFNDYEDQRLVNNVLVDFSEKLGVKIVPTTDAHYLTPEDWKVHDTLLAIGQGLPVRMKGRLRYHTNDFYVKDREDVITFLRRYYKDKAEEYCNNTILAADMCENPKWIDPRSHTGKDWELPVFPVKDQVDYQQFLNWLADHPEFQGKDEDVNYLRYWSYNSLEKIGKLNNQVYIDRVEKELDTFEFRDLSSYMLIVADYINWAKNNDCLVGPGRGCLEGKTPVLTSKGFKNLQDIKVGDWVYTHTGKLQKVINKLCYDVDETCAEVHTNFSFEPITMTFDHKVFGVKSKETERYIKFKNKNKKSLRKIKRWEKPSKPDWFSIQELKENDLIFMPYLERKKKKYSIDDDTLYFLGRWIGDGWFYYHPKCGYQVGIAHHSNDTKGVNKILSYLSSRGLNIKKEIHKNKKLIQIKVHNKKFQDLIRSFVPDYSNKSSTKHLPIFFRELSDEQLKILLLGLMDADGHVENGPRHLNRENFDTTSKRLALEVKEALMFLGIPSSIYTRNAYQHGKYLCSESYKVRFKGLSLIKSKNNNLLSGYFCKINKISTKKLKKVYDISVENDTSYLTSNYAVHNSAGGSLVGYLIGIHDADSIKYDLIFERFYSKIKKGISDIDTDFGQASKPKVQEYLVRKYGKDMVAHVSNLSTMTPKVYVKDICRAFEYGGNRSSAAEIGQKIADTIPNTVKTIDQALDEAPLFAEYVNQKYKELEIYKEISGSIRNLSTHAGGIIIASRPIHELVPTRRDKDFNYAIEYDKDRAEENSLVKMDILGVSTLDIIDNTLKIIKARGKPPPPPWDYDDPSPETYELISSGNTYGIFQLGTSQNTMAICQKMKPKNIEDLAMINSMARPGFPRNVIDEFISDKENGKIANLIHPILKEALSPTFGYALFDEVLLKLAETVAGWDLAEADRLRKFVKEKGKNPKKDKQLREDFIEGSVTNKGLTYEEATQIWDEVVAKLGSYIFNKSHAVCYSMIGYQTAYLKAHYPLEFTVANLIYEDSSNSQTKDKNIQEFKKELRTNDIKILPPDLNKSQEVYSILDDGNILTGFSSLKQIGKDAIPEIMAKRPFKDFDDFLTRVDNTKVRINSIYSLASAGCLDQFGLTRRQICLYASDYRKKLTTWQERRPDEEFVYPWPEDVYEWSIPEMYAQEVFYLGEGLCCGIKEAYPNFFNNWALDFSRIPEIFPEPDQSGQKFFIPANIGVVQGVITDLFEFTVKKETSKIYGQTMAKLELQDPWGNTIPMTLFPSSLETFLDRLRTLSRGKIELGVGIAIHCAASINWYEGEPSLIFEDLRQVAPIPPRPKDLNPRKVIMKITKNKTEKKKTNKINRTKFTNDVESELIEEGFSDIEYE